MVISDVGCSTDVNTYLYFKESAIWSQRDCVGDYKKYEWPTLSVFEDIQFIMWLIMQIKKNRHDCNARQADV